MAPYVITVLVLVVLSATHRHGAPAAPAALGRTFHAST
jgi:simple sugar transport system permease protein